MNEFVFLYRNGERPRSPEQMQQVLPQWAAWFSQLSAQGHLIERGQPLEPTGKLVGKVVTDGPFTEAKDVIGGYTLIKAHDINAAAELARGCPLIQRGGHVEVRPVLKLNG